MGFLSNDYRNQVDEEEKKRQQKQPQQAQPSKSNDTRSTAQKVGGFLNAAGRAVFKNTAKFTNQAYQEGKQVVDTSKMLTAQATDNQKAFENANKQSQEDYKGFKRSGGLFNVGTFNTEKEARTGDVKAGIKKIGVGTAGVATEILPFARGAGIGAKGSTYVAKGATAADKGSKLGSFGKLSAEGAAYGAVNNVIDSATEDKPLTLEDTIKSALIGGGAAGGTGLVGRLFSKGAARTADEALPNLSAKEADSFMPTKIPVTQVEDSTAGTISKNGLPTTTPTSTPLATKPVDDVDFRYNFNDNAAEAAKLPVTAKLGNTNTPDPVNFVVSAITNSKSSKQISNITKKLVPNLTTKENRELAVKLKDTTNENSVKEILNAASQNTQSSPQPISPATNISFADTPSKRMANALVDNGDVASLEVPISRNGFTQPPLTTNIDTRVTGIDDAKNYVAAARSESPSATAAVSAPKRAQAALVGEDASTSIPAREAVTPVGEGAQNIVRKLDAQLASYDKNLAAPKELLKKLEGSKAVSTPARANDWLDDYEDTLGVLGRHFGRVGTDIGYKLAEGAKVRSDIQERLLPTATNALKELDKIAKSDSAKTDVQTRIYSALEDRANAANYLKNAGEKKLYDSAVAVLDNVKQMRIDRGKAVVGENYSPRAAIRDALDAPDRLFDSARTAFGRDVSSTFSKQREKDIPDAEINRRIIELLPQYISSQSKEFAYEGAIDYMKKEMPNINPAYLTDSKGVRKGTQYLQTLVKQVLDPRMASSAERFQNKLIATTYRNQLGFSLKYAAQNLTQRFSTMANVSKEARNLAGDIDKADLDVLRKGSFSGEATHSSEALQSGDNLVGSGGKVDAFFRKFDPGAKTEKGNVYNAFDSGASQAIVESDAYKKAIKSGLKPRDAAKHALQDEAVRDMAIRRGNVVVNDTQFGANFVTKPEFFRDSGTFFGLSDKWYKQYQRFPMGMVQQMTTVLKGTDARALDILRRGNPAETNLVDYRKSAEALYNGVDDVIKGIKEGSVHDVSLEVAQGYKKSLGKAVDELGKQMKQVSQVRGHKTLKALGAMWAASSAIQFIFDPDGGVAKAAKYGSPLSVPSKDQNPLIGSFIPSSPIGRNGIKWDKAANLVPGVGLAVNRGKEIKRFLGALTGDNQQ